jgi:hypothetical protein
MRIFGGGLALASILAVAAPAVCGPATLPLNSDIGLATHRAEYIMSLNSTRMSGGVTSATGKMTYRFADSCDGWTVENKTAVAFAYADAAPVATTWDYLTWESKDGLKFRFRVRSTRDGSVNEEIAGTAQLDGKGKGGTVKFTQPETKSVALPEGTLFPTEHTVRLIEAAQKGGHLLTKVVFDGTDAGGPFNVTGIVTRLEPANSNSGPAVNQSGVNAALLSAPSWFMQLAFFAVGSSAAEPDYEVGLRYYSNGVADEMIQSFGDFTLKASLSKLEPLPKPDC